MGETQGYTPEDLLETEGANKGNIKDKEIAQEMAEAEDKVRDPKKIDEAVRVVGTILEGAWMAGRTGFELGKESKERRAHSSALEAANKEIDKRIRTEAEKKGINDQEAIEAEIWDAQSTFEEEQKRLTEERIEEARKKIQES